MMVRRFISIKLVLVLGLTSLGLHFPAVKAASNIDKCEKGECVPALLDRLKNLGTKYQQECLPKGKIPPNLEAYHRAHGLSESCWKYITEINYLESKLLRVQNQLETKAGCSNGNCQLPAEAENLKLNLNQFSHVGEELSCTEPRKIAVQKQCPDDLNCVLASSALSLASLPAGAMGGYVAEQFLPEKNKIKNCHLGNDSCVTQLGTAFFKATMTYLSGAWDLLKIAGSTAGKKMGEFWDWVSGAENHTSTSQLALAKASEDPSVFQALIDDFPGTMKKIWQTFVASIKDWLKTSIFCEKWQGAPHLGKCLKPADSYDCLPCKTLVTGLCGISGTLVAEVVPNFLAGGLITAVKHGAKGAAKISKLFKVSKSSIKAVQASSLSKTASRMSKVIIAGKAAVGISLKAIKTYLLSPARKTLKASYSALSNLTKKGSVFLAETATGRAIKFSGTAAKNTLEIVLYPIDNPLTTLAYKAGAKTMDKAFKLGAPKLARSTTVTAAIIESNAKLEPLLARIEKSKMSGRVNAKQLVKLEEELFLKVAPIRQNLVRTAFKKGNVEITDLIKHLYPELQYDELAKVLPKTKIIQAEKELYKEITRLPKGPAKKAYLANYKMHVGTGQKRSLVLKASAIANKNPVHIPNVSTGVSKVVSPTLRGSQEEEKEK
ncbi:MAG: hypothetical protein NDI69_09700 [Bacteriovoracaceae bacterium]|nr:hypothetical protein [Bacteriovoracaceae bacterium]